MRSKWNKYALLALFVLLTGCIHHPARIKNPPPRRPSAASDSGPRIAPDISGIPEPVPKPEPMARYGNKSPYTVLGESYRVLPSARGYVERGIASWYGTKFHGHVTSTFENYDMYQFSAAHKTLPLPTYAQITNLENNKSVIVRINDRGPFKDNRIIDLSYVAAVKLGIWEKGTGLVEVRALDPAHSGKPPIAAETPALAKVAAQAQPPQMYLQVGAYAERGNAERIVAVLERAQVGHVRIVSTRMERQTLHRVKIGPLANVDEVDRLSPQIERLGLGKPHVALDD